MSTPGGRWLMVSFDLPSRSKAQRRDAVRFGHGLIDSGYLRLHDSLYLCYLPPRSRLATEVNRVTSQLPPRGTVVVVDVSDAGVQRSLHLRDGMMQTALSVPEMLIVY